MKIQSVSSIHKTSDRKQIISSTVKKQKDKKNTDDRFEKILKDVISKKK